MVGAGATGTAAALHLARAGLRVALLDARPFEHAGARWINYVPEWMFEAADLRPPAPPERVGGPRPAAMILAVGALRTRIDDNACLAVDMRRLVARLHGLAAEAGVTPFSGVHVHHVECRDGRPTAVQTDRGPLSAGLFIDASGLNGVLRRQIPRLAVDCPAVDAEHLCSAAQEVCRITDSEAAAQFRVANGLGPDEILSHPGVAGGYSTLNVAVDAEHAHADVLTGCRVGSGTSGPALMDEARRRFPFIGERLFGGAGLIPLRRPYDRLSAPGVALLGDAGCQVFPAHGSGVGMGLLAARLLAEQVAGASDPGDPRALWRYQAEFHRRHGATLAAYDLFRRLTQSLCAEDFEALLRAGLVNPRQMALGLRQSLPAVGGLEVAGFLRALVAKPALAARAAAALSPMPALVALYENHPAEPGERALRLWSRAVATAFRERPDVR